MTESLLSCSDIQEPQIDTICEWIKNNLYFFGDPGGQTCLN